MNEDVFAVLHELFGLVLAFDRRELADRGSKFPVQTGKVPYAQEVKTHGAELSTISCIFWIARRCDVIVVLSRCNDVSAKLIVAQCSEEL